MRLSCERCGEGFDTEREHPAGRHASGTRCPACGCDHDTGGGAPAVVDRDGSAGSESAEVAAQVAALAGEGDGDIHIHLHRD